MATGSGRQHDTYEAAEDRLSRVKRLESQCLNELSLKQLKMWLDEDAEKITSKVKICSNVVFVSACVHHMVVASLKSAQGLRTDLSATDYVFTLLYLPFAIPF